MSYEYDADGNDFDQNPGGLRAALEKANKRAEAAEKANADLQKTVNEFKLNSVLSDLGVPPKIQRWMKRDGIEPTPEAAKQWLDENAEDFGWKPGDAAEKPEGQESAPEEAPAAENRSVLTDEDIAAQQRIQQVTAAGVGQTQSSDQAEAAVAAVASSLGADAKYEDVIAALRAQGIPVESTFG